MRVRTASSYRVLTNIKVARAVRRPSEITNAEAACCLTHVSRSSDWSADAADAALDPWTNL